VEHHIGRFGQCSFILSHEDDFTVEHASYPGAEAIRGRRGIQLIDGEAHRKLHTFLNGYFSSRIADLEERIIRPLVAGAIARCAGRDSIEILEEFAAPLSLRVITAVLGLRHDDTELLERFARWRDAMTPWVVTQGRSARDRDHAIEAALSLREIVVPTIRERREAPRDDLVSALWRIGPSVFPDWSEEDTFDQCRIMLLAGSEGVARLTSTVVHLVLAAPERRSRLLAGGREAAFTFVEHASRLHPPAQLRPRIALHCLELGENTIGPGDRLLVDVVGANLDPDRFPPVADPILDGPGAHHLAFNVGSRYCSGAPLARSEVAEATHAFFGSFPHCRPSQTATPPAFGGFLFLGFSPVHVRLR
jgi:cytochrome P450